MKMFKRLLTLCVALLLLCTPALAYNAGTLRYLGAIPDGITDSTVVTREILAYSLTKVLMPNSEYEAIDTVFTDVKADNLYSGYISFVSQRGIMNGSGDGLFNPKKAVSINEVSKTLVTSLGYEMVAEAKGGWPGGYTFVASSLKLYNGVNISSGEVLYGDLKVMLSNLLKTSVPEEIIHTQNGSYELMLKTSGDRLLYAEKNLDLYAYEGIITDVDYESYKAEVTFGKQDKNSKYVEGNKVIFDIANTINVSVFENVPARFVVYDDKTIVDIETQEGIKIRYGVVDSVNNETDDVNYNTKHINAITLWDDENDYEFADDCIFSYNNKHYTGKVSLINEYVRIVEKDEEILALSFWDLVDGGKITKTASAYLYFTVGSTERRLDRISEATETLVLIDGEARDYKELKEGMVFSYYQNTTDNILVIVATEKKMVDVLFGINVSDKTLKLGDTEIMYRDDIYTSVDGMGYTQGAVSLMDFSDEDIIVYFDIYNRASYVESYTKIAKEEFFGYLLGYKDADGLKGPKAQVIAVNEEGTPTRVYNVSKKLAFEGEGLNLDTLKASIGTADGSALYEIGFNSKGEIKSFSRLKEYEGFEGFSWTGSWGSFIDHGNPYLVINGKKIFIPKTTPVICIKADTSDVEVYKIEYSKLIGKSCNNKIRLKFYGYDNSPELRMAVMIGDMHVVSGTKGIGIVDRCGKMLDADGEEFSSVTINDKTYRIMSNSTATPKKGNLVSYDISLFDTGAVRINDAIDIKDDFANWNGKAYGKSTFYSGVIEKADQLKLTIELFNDTTIGDNKYKAGDSLCYYYERGSVTYYGINEDGSVTSLAYQDIKPGMKAVIGVEKDSNGGGSIKQVFTRKD